MRRTIVLKNTATGQAITLPVTPKSYPMEAGRLVERLDMAVTGQIALPGLLGLFVGTLEFWLPARSYPFLNSGAVTQPSYYIELLTAWARSGAVCRYIVTGAGINAAVLLGMLEYGESDGTNDVQCKLPLYEYRYLESAQVVQATQNAKRPAGSTKPQTTTGEKRREMFNYSSVYNDPDKRSAAMKEDIAEYKRMCRTQLGLKNRK